MVRYWFSAWTKAVSFNFYSENSNNSMYLKARVKENTITPFASKYASKCLHSYSALLYFCWKAMAIVLFYLY